MTDQKNDNKEQLLATVIMKTTSQVMSPSITAEVEINDLIKASPLDASDEEELQDKATTSEGTFAKEFERFRGDSMSSTERTDEAEIHPEW